MSNKKDIKDKEKRHNLAVLLLHNRWRRDDHFPNARKMVNPIELWKVIDYAIQHIKGK